MNSCNTTQKTSSMPEPSNKFTVYCDTCNEPTRWTTTMNDGSRAFVCYPCNNVIYESELTTYRSKEEDQ